MRKYTNPQMEREIDTHVHSARDRMILKLIYLDDLPYERIAEIYDITSRTVDNVVRRFKNVSPIFRV